MEHSGDGEGTRLSASVSRGPSSARELGHSDVLSVINPLLQKRQKVQKKDDEQRQLQRGSSVEVRPAAAASSSPKGSRPVLWGDPTQRHLWEQITGSPRGIKRGDMRGHETMDFDEGTGDGRAEYVTMMFTCSVQCPRGNEKDTVSHFLAVVRSVVPRVRLEASTESHVSSADGAGAVFDVMIQVVPMHSLLQVSRELVTNWPRMRLIAASRSFIAFAIFTYLMLFAVITYWVFDPNSKDSLEIISGFAWSAVALVSASTLILFSQFSIPLLILVLRTYDFWLLVFWIVISALCSLQRHVYNGVPLTASRISAASLVVSQIVVLLLDAFPALPRKWKGCISLLNATFNGYRYAMWYFDARGSGLTSKAVVDLGTFDLHLATAGQAAGWALLAYNLRLAVRSLVKKLDLALIDFAVNVVSQQEDLSAAEPPVTAASSENDSMLHETKFAAVKRISAGFLQHNSFSNKSTRSTSSTAGDSNFVTVHISGSFPVDESALVSTTAELQKLCATVGAQLSFFPHLEVTMFDSDRRTFVPTTHMMTFSPKPLIAIPQIYLGLCSVWWPRIVVCCVAFGAVLMLLVDVLDKSNYIGIAAVQSFLFTIAVTQLLFGVSVAMVRHAVFTLDFWYVAVVFGSQVIAKGYVYANAYDTSLAVVHILLVSSTALFVATIDCLSIPSFDLVIKGICGLVLGAYCILDLVYTTPAAIRAKPELYDKTIDMWIFVLSPGSMAQLASFACFLCFVRISARTLWMRSTLVFLQLGAVEEKLDS